MLPCPSCHAETINLRARGSWSWRSAVACPKCGERCRVDFRALQWPFGACVGSVVAFFALTLYAQSLSAASLPVVFGMLISNLLLIASAIWLIVSLFKLPLRPDGAAGAQS
jgi:hypothetical protein